MRKYAEVRENTQPEQDPASATKKQPKTNKTKKPIGAQHKNKTSETKNLPKTTPKNFPNTGREQNINTHPHN